MWMADHAHWALGLLLSSCCFHVAWVWSNVMAVTQCPHAEGGNQLLRDPWSFAGHSSPLLSDSACDMLIYMSIHCQYYVFTDCSLSTLPLFIVMTFVWLAAKSSLQERVFFPSTLGKRRKWFLVIHFNSKASLVHLILSGLVNSHATNQQHTSFANVHTLNFWDRSSIGHLGSVCRDLRRPGSWLGYLKRP